MNKKNKAKRYLAGLLTVLMIFQQSGMNSILADSDEVPVTFAAERNWQDMMKYRSTRDRLRRKKQWKSLSQKK